MVSMAYESPCIEYLLLLLAFIDILSFSKHFNEIRADYIGTIKS